MIEAWHFLREGGVYRDGGKASVGDVLTVTPPLIICRHGLHASEKIIDALSYAPGPVVCRVLVSGETIQTDDKLCGERREIVWMKDISKELHEFACRCAEKALEEERKAGREPDERSRAAVQAKRDWIAE